MKGRLPILLLAVVELLLLLLVVAPVVHMRSFTERILLTSVEHLPPMAPDEPLYILLRTGLMVLALMIVFGLRDLYRWSLIVRPQVVVVRLIEASIAVLVALPLLHYGLGEIDRALDLNGVLLRMRIHPLLVVAGTGVGFLAAYGLRMQFPRWIRGSGLAERLALVGGGPLIDVLEEEIRRQHDPSFEFLGVIADGQGPSGRQLLGSPEDILDLARAHGLQRLVLSRHVDLPSDTLLQLRMAGVNIVDGNSFYERLTGRISPESLSEPDLFLTSGGAGFAYPALKRLVDIVCATLLLTLALPVIIVTAILIKLESRGPIFYSQERLGANGVGFQISKFRSMRADAESSSGPVWAQKNDSRVTRVGKWIRKLRVDEIPQLWAVLRNDMSLVGPRPEREFFVQELEAKIPHFGRRHLVKPGVTGWAQINYSYGNTVDDAFVKLQFDLYYIKHRSVALDLAIILRTVKVVVLQQGAV